MLATESVSQTESQQIHQKEYLAYGGFFFGQNVIYMALSSFLMIYYTNVVAISAVTVGTLLFISKFWDAINDPLMGFVIEKVHFKSGKFLPWIRLATLFFPIVFILLFQNPFTTNGLKITYILVTYFIFDTVYTFSDVPIFSLSTVVTEELGERTKFLAFGRLFAIFGAMVPIILVPKAIKTGHWTVAIVSLALLAFIVMLPLSFIGKERIARKTTHTKESFWAILKTIVSNKYLSIYLLSFFILRMFAVSTLAGNYFYAFVMGDPGLITVAGIAGLLPAVLLALCIPRLVQRFGKRQIYIALHLISIAFMLITFFVGYQKPMLFIGLTLLSSLAFIATSVMNGMFVGDCIEYGEATSGKRFEGIAFAIQTFMNKAATAVVSMFGGILLTAFGFIAHHKITPTTANGIFSMMTIIPMIGIIISLLIFAKYYRLDEQTVQSMTYENDQTKVEK